MFSKKAQTSETTEAFDLLELPKLSNYENSFFFIFGSLKRKMKPKPKLMYHNQVSVVLRKS